MAWIKQKDADGLEQPRTVAPRPDGRRAAGPTDADAVDYGRISIGSSMEIKGEVTGNEDLTINGKVDGKIFLNGHKLTVARDGRIRAEINGAASVVVQGEMIGNITARDRVEVASTGSMSGDISAPRVALAEGASFKGRIDMSPEPPVPRHDRPMREPIETEPQILSP